MVLINNRLLFKQPEQFLRNRKWEVFLTNDLREAISLVFEHKPDFVMLSADYPNRKILTLPKLLDQVVAVKVIGFIENTTGSSMGLLNELGVPYNIYPPVSGPAIERTVLKIKKDEDAPRGSSASTPRVSRSLTEPREKDDRGPAYLGSAFGGTSQKGDPSDDFMRFLDDEAAKSDTSLVAKGSAGDSNLAYMPQNPGSTSQGPNARSSTTSSGGLYVPSSSNDKSDSSGGGGTIGTTEDSMAARNAPSTSREGDANGSPVDGETASDGNRKKTARPRFEFNEKDPLKKPKATLGEIGDLPERDQDGDPTKTQKKSDLTAEPRSDKSPRSKAVSKPAFSLQTPTRTEDAKQPQQQARSGGGPEYLKDPSEYPGSGSLFARGAQRALEESAIVSETAEFERLQKTTQVACLAIESPKYSGYLVAAMGQNRRVDQEFMNLVRRRLTEFLHSHGESIRGDDPAQLKIEQVEFEGWAMEHAEFLRKTIHKSNEVALAFFPSKRTQVNLEQSAAESMLQLDIDEIQDDVPVEFDLYIFLPTNNRFLLYTPVGRPIYGPQRSRLKARGINHVHLRKEDLKGVKKYRAQNFLNSKIIDKKKIAS